MSQRTLLPEVAEKYVLVGIRPGKYNFNGFGEIDLRTISVQKADQLFKDGFSHLKLKEIPEKDSKENILDILKQVDQSEFEDAILNKPTPIPAPTEAEFSPPEESRKNKKFINNLLTLDYSQIAYQNKLIFFNDEEYFLAKKQLMIRNGNIEQNMRSLHAKVKAIDPDPKFNEDREKIMNALATLDDEKAENWQLIDTWVEPEPDIILDTAAAIQKALEIEKLVKAHGNYIYRAEITIPGMPEETEKQKKKKADKLAEVKRRKDELIKLSAPYDRKPRKK
jgi:hypothetical protein